MISFLRTTVSRLLGRKRSNWLKRGNLAQKTYAQENKDLNDSEYKTRKLILKSYPTYVAMNLSDVCTVSCKFCRYNFYEPHRRMVTLDDIRSQQWLRYPQTVDLFCGVGESLVNPHFPDIFQYMKENYPYQYRGLTTNGTLLTEGLIQQFLESASWLHFSVNAFKRETYRDVMRKDKRDHVFAGIEALCKGRIERGVGTPTITLSYVAVRRNIEEFVEFVDYFGAMGVDNIVLFNYNTTDTDLRQSRRLPCEESLLYHKDISEEIFKEAKEVSRKYSTLTLKLPDMKGLQGPFPADVDVFDKAVCTNPWKTAYIDTLTSGRWMQFCCTFLTNHSPLTTFDFDQPFEKVWNSEFMQWVRRASLDGNLNPSCAFCKSHDLSNPQNNDARKKAVVEGQKIYEKYVGQKGIFGEEF